MLNYWKKITNMKFLVRQNKKNGSIHRVHVDKMVHCVLYKVHKFSLMIPLKMIGDGRCINAAWQRQNSGFSELSLYKLCLQPLRFERIFWIRQNPWPFGNRWHVLELAGRTWKSFVMPPSHRRWSVTRSKVYMPKTRHLSSRNVFFGQEIHLL